jgi:hypothetical protein
MGSEAETTMRIGRGPTVAGKVLLETDFLLFRGPRRLKIAFADVRGVTAEDGLLRVAFGKETATFELGAKAAPWAQKILKPKGRLEKLGLVPGATAAMHGAFDDDFVAEVAPFVARGRKTLDHVFLAVEAKGALARVARIAKTLGDAGLWIVYPKGKTEIREADVIGAGRAAGLKDVKVVRFSDTHTALRFVVPKAKR